MATQHRKTDSSPFRQDVGTDIQDRIIIERREVVAALTLGNTGSPALEMAYAQMGIYMQENLAEASPMTLEFWFLGRKFTATAHPVPMANDSIGDDGPDY